MPWTSIRIDRDSGNPSICTATASFEDGAGFSYTFTKTVTFDSPGKTDFVSSAKSALVAAQSKSAAEKSIESSVLAALNA